MYSRISWEATSGLMPIGAQHGRGRLMRPKRASSANMIRGLAWRQPALPSSQHLESHFFKSVFDALGVKRTRHQLAPAVPGHLALVAFYHMFPPNQMI